MTQIPGRIKIGSRLYTVYCDDKSWREMQEAEDRELEGRSHHPREEILVRPGRTANWTADTLLHETLHGMFNLHGVDLQNVKELEHLEEYVVSVLAPILLMVLRDNPGLVEFLLSPEVPWDLPTQPSPQRAGRPGECSECGEPQGAHDSEGCPR